MQAQVEARRSNLFTISVLFLILVAFGLRVYGLDLQSLSPDEGISVIRSSEPLLDIWRNMPVEHVHGYFFLLHGWFALAGDTDFTLRYLSVLPAVWAVAILYRFGVDLGSRKAGWVVAALVATNVFQVWYAQEARMYSWMFALAALSLWSFWRISPMFAERVEARGAEDGTRAPKRQSALWTVYILSTAGLVYLHYFSLMIPLLQTLLAVGWLLLDFRARRDWFLRWCGAGFAVLLLYGPLLPQLLGIFGFPGWRDPLDPNTLPGMLFFGYTLDGYVEGAPATLAHWLYGILLGVGLWFWLRLRPAAGGLLAVILLGGAGILYGLLLRNPDFHIRYSIYLSIPLYLLVAGGLVAPLTWVRERVKVWTWGRMRGGTAHLIHWGSALVSAVLLLVLLTVNGMALERHYLDEETHKTDYRQHTRLIEATGKAGDVILSMGPNPDLVFDRYYRGNLPILDITELATATPEDAIRELEELLVDYNRAWVLLRYFEPGAVQVFLAHHTWPSPPAHEEDLRLTLYGLWEPDLNYTPLDVSFGESLVLRTGGVAAQGALPGLIPVQTQWEVVDTPPNLKFSVRLLDGAGEIVQALDYEALNWFFPTWQWPVGEIVADRHAFFLTETLPPGRYTVTVRLYDPETGAAIDTEQGPDVVVGHVDVADEDVEMMSGISDSVDE